MQRFDWRRAVGAYRELRAAEPNDERLAITLIDLYFRVGQGESALKELDRYLIQLIKSGRGAKVPGILVDMVERRPGNAGLVNRLVRLYLQQKKLQPAVQILDKLGEEQLNAGQTESAIKTIENILKLRPPNAISYKQLLDRLYQDVSG
jgi:tetratricopeptide (TPR) repeat protein